MKLWRRGSRKTDFDPGKATVDEVLAYLRKNPQHRAEIVAREQAGKNRKSIINP